MSGTLAWGPQSVGHTFAARPTRESTRLQSPEPGAWSPKP